MRRMRDETSLIIPAVRAVLDEALAAGRRTTDGGKAIDEHQVHAERLAYAATEAAAAEALATYARERAGDEVIGRMAAAFAGEVASRLGAEIEGHRDDFGVRGDTLARTLGAPEVLAAVRAAQHDERVPESIIRRMAELGYFGMSVPEEYGGQGMGNLVMIVITEELSAASLAAAGSLITRPEILTKALLKCGTEAQKRKWLPPVASGALMVGISVTEPDTGSDVASVRCRAERTAGGWVISGAKAWCTFAGRADVLALLARTNPDPKAGARGLSLFIVPKDPFPGHEFEMRQPGGGVLHGKADATPGYRGMHSFTLGFENYLVPAENLIGEAAGEGKGFYL